MVVLRVCLREKAGTDSWAISYSISPHVLEREHSVDAGNQKVPGAASHPCIGRRGCHSGRAVVVAQGNAPEGQNRWSLTAHVVVISQDLQDTPGRCHLLSSGAGQLQTLVVAGPGLCISCPQLWPSFPTVLVGSGISPGSLNSPGFSPHPLRHPPLGPACGGSAPRCSTCRQASLLGPDPTSMMITSTCTLGGRGRSGWKCLARATR